MVSASSAPASAPARSGEGRGARRRAARRRARLRFWLGCFAVTLVGFGGLTGDAASGAAPRRTASGFKTVFRDDFNRTSGAGLNVSRWRYDLGHGYPGGPVNWGTGEIESATDATENVYQDGSGHVAIKPLRDSGGKWTSGRIETEESDFAAPAGGILRVEARIRQPNVTAANGSGYWPAFWMLAGAVRHGGSIDYPRVGEIDIWEAVNGRGTVFHTLHCGVSVGGPCHEDTGLTGGEQSCQNCGTKFHSYALEYDRSMAPEQLRYSVDGQTELLISADQVDAATWNAALHHGFIVVLDVAIGGGFPHAFGGSPDGSGAATASGKPMLIDYVEVSIKPSPRA